MNILSFRKKTEPVIRFCGALARLRLVRVLKNHYLENQDCK